jgi:hypothetical protein
MEQIIMLQPNAVICLLLLSFSAHAEVYKWVDSNGKTHFGDKVPESAKVEKLNFQSSPRTSQPDVSPEEIKQRQQKLINAIDEDRSLKQKMTQEQTEKKAKLNQECTKLRDYLKNIRSGRIYDINNKGERVYANDAEHDKEVKQTESMLKKYCR